MPARKQNGRSGRTGALALGLLVLLGAARAQAADAPALEAQLHGWLAALLGPHAALGDRPVQVTPQDDHFALAIPIAGSIGGTGITLDGAPITASLRSLDGGRWALDDIRLPSPLRIAALGNDGESSSTYTMQDQDQHAILDPGLATQSTWDGTLGGYAAHMQGPGGERHSEAAHILTHIAWQPTSTGRIDITETAGSDLLSSSANTKKLGVVSFSAARSRLTAHVDALAPERVPPLLHAAFDAAPLLLATANSAAAAPHTVPQLSPELRTAVGAILDVAGDVIGGFGELVTLENVHLHAREFDAALRSVEFGVSAAVPDGRLSLQLHLALDGLDSNVVPPGPLHDYLPRHVALSPRLSGLPADQTLALLRRAVASGGDDPTLSADAMTLVSDGPLALGIDDFAVAFGPATFSAVGELRIAGPDQIAGHAHIQATGLDALIHDAHTIPMLQQALPVLIFLKGIGEPQGTATVWNLLYAGGKLTVNGTDLSQMMPGK